jgi:hypothetical protein
LNGIYIFFAVVSSAMVLTYRAVPFEKTVISMVVEQRRHFHGKWRQIDISIKTLDIIHNLALI